MSKHERKCKIMTVTPDVAAKWLEKNTHNRTFHPNIMQEYAAAMKRGEWLLTPEAIAFSKPFRDPVTQIDMPECLIEGQHRLWAVVESGATVQMTVWWGCEPDEFKVVGQGAERTNGDILSITRKDLKNPTAVASVCAAFARFGIAYKLALNSWVVRTMLDHFENEIVETANAKSRLGKIAPRPVTAALLMAQIVNPSQTGVLIKQLKDAIGFTERDPARALHLYLSNWTASTNRDSMDILFYKTANAVSAKLQGRPLQVLRVNTDGLTWLREAGKERLEPMLRAINGRVPVNFYTPQLQKLVVDHEEGSEKIAAAGK